MAIAAWQEASISPASGHRAQVAMMDAKEPSEWKATLVEVEIRRSPRSTTRAGLLGCYNIPFAGASRNSSCSFSRTDPMLLCLTQCTPRLGVVIRHAEALYGAQI